MLLELKRTAKAVGTNECVALEKGIAEAQASIAAAGGTEGNADLRATLAAFIAQCEKRIAEIKALKAR